MVKGLKAGLSLPLWTLLDEAAPPSLCFMHSVLLLHRDTPGFCLLGVIGGSLMVMVGSTKVIVPFL